MNPTTSTSRVWRGNDTPTRMCSFFASLLVSLLLLTPCSAEIVRPDEDADDSDARAVWVANPYNIDVDGTNVCVQTGLRVASIFVSADELYSDCDSIFPPATCTALRSGFISVEDLYLLTENYTCCDGFQRQDVSCQTLCAGQTYGPGCSLTCQCLNGGACDPVSGACQCPAGWTGQYCQRTCPDGRYGQGCAGVCQCHSDGGSCDPVTGDCMCHDNYVGDQCDIDCGATTPASISGCPTSSGALCDTCQRVDACDISLGTCLCLPGWQGRFCTHTCGESAHGVFCLDPCECVHASACRHGDGACVCLPGWTGAACGGECPAGSYGDGCRLRCNCPDGSECDPVDGRCLQCPIGWEGELCTYPCESGRWGQGCSQDCNCAESEDCEPSSGLCVIQDDGDDFVSTTPLSGSDPALSTGQIAAIAGAAALVLVLGFAVVLVIVRRCHRNPPPVPRQRQVSVNGVGGQLVNPRYQTDPRRSEAPPTPMPRDPATFTTGVSGADAGYYEAVADESSNGRSRRDLPSYMELDGARPKTVQVGNPLYSRGDVAGGDEYEIPTPQSTFDRAELPMSTGNRYRLTNTAERNASSDYTYIS